MNIPDLSGKRILVTGAAGFIGGRVVEMLAQDKRPTVRALLRSHARAPRVACFPVELAVGDVADPITLRRAADGCHVIVHAAWSYGAKEKPAMVRARNLAGVRQVLACGKAVRARVVFLSSLAVYEASHDGALTEAGPRRVTPDAYAQAKLDAEALVRNQADVEAVILQPTIVYGPGSMDWSVAPLRRMRQNTMVLDDSLGLCNAVYIDDLVQAIVRASVAPAAPGETMLVSGPAPVTWLEFFRSYERMIGEPSLETRSASDIEAQWRRKRWEKRRSVVRAWTSDNAALIAAYRFLKFSVWRQPVTSTNPVVPMAIATAARQKPLAMPTPPMLALYQSRAAVDIAKARRLLGYEPAFDLTRGMALTESWAHWMKIL